LSWSIDIEHSNWAFNVTIMRESEQTSLHSEKKHLLSWSIYYVATYHKLWEKITNLPALNLKYHCMLFDGHWLIDRKSEQLSIMSYIQRIIAYSNKQLY